MWLEGGKKEDKYPNLKHDIVCLCKLRKVEVIPVVLGALGMVTNQ